MSISLPSIRQKTIIYAGPTPFPSNSAASRRILGNACALKEAGYNVLILAGQVADCSKELKSQEHGLTIVPVGERAFENYPRLLKHIWYINMGKKTVKKLENLDIDIHAIILYSGYSPFLLRLLPWCNSNNIKLIFDAVEWYLPSSITRRFIDPYYLNIEFAMRRLIPKTQNVIVISTFLNNYFKGKNCKTIIIPPLLDVLAIKPRLSSTRPYSDKSLVLSYTGSPGKKDLINNICEVVLLEFTKVPRITLHLAGISDQDLLKLPAFQNRRMNEIPKNIISEGLVSHARAIEITRNSDFSLLQREDNLVSNAGFPTKLVESLACGTPVIVNLTSDIGNYINDGLEGVLLKGPNVSSLIKGLQKAMNYSERDLILMRRQARTRAEQSFDYRNYVEMLSKFIED